MDVKEIRKLVDKFAQVVGGGKLIIVDVQPEYEGFIGFDIGELLGVAVGYSRILVLWNGPELGMSSEEDLRRYYLEKMNYDEELYEEFISRAEFFDKGYGFFREIMDHPCFSSEDVEKIAGYMIDNEIRDIRDLGEGDVELIGVDELLVEDLEGYGFFIPDLKDVLKDWSGADLVGGQERECLAEVEVLSKVMGIGLNKIRKFIY
jgi:hypothetical protein